MIVDMKKVTLLCLESNRATTLDALRDLGVLHLTPLQPPESADLDTARRELRRAETALARLKAIDDVPATRLEKEPSRVIDRVEAIVAERKQATERIEALQQEVTAIEPFGDFDPESIHKLQARGIHVQLGTIVSKTPPSSPEGTVLFVLCKHGREYRVAIVGDMKAPFPGDPFPLPEHRLADLVQDMAAAEEARTECDRQLAALVGAVDALDQEVKRRHDAALYLEARDGMGAEGRVAFLQGYCPVDAESALRERAKECGWGLVLDDPGETDPVPTLVRYPRWARVMQPVFQFLGIVPGYKELDISATFFIFLSIFFAMIVGDAGYGFLFLLLVPYFQKKVFPKAPGLLYKLLYVFSVSTVLWGVLTGNYFGIDFEYLPGFMQFRVEYIVGQDNSMTLAMFLGAIHLTLAHGWNAARYHNDMRALVQVGWIGIVWGMFLGARYLLIGSDFPIWYAFVAVVAFLAIPVGLIRRKSWLDLGLIPLDLVSCFGDIMSYLRLFALGVASVEVAAAFNGMAAIAGTGIMDALGGGRLEIVGWILASLAMGGILLIGHGLNVVLCAMSVLVHGVRLNALEYSMHLGQEWSGHEYRPFVKQSKADTMAA